MTTTLTAGPAQTATDPSRNKTSFAPWFAFLWALLTLSLAVLHFAGRGPAPWIPTEASAIGALSVSTVASVLAGLALLWLAALAVVARSGHRPRHAAGVALVVIGLVVALAVADVRGLSMLGYGPMLLLGLFGVGPAAGVDPRILGPSLLSLSHTLGGFGLALTGMAALSRSAAPSPHASARSDAQAAQRRATALRVGRWTVALAVAIPLCYASTRIAWALGLPFGVREEFLTELGDRKLAGLGLGLFACVGCLLTLGLVQRWGEVFWSWLPGIGGRPVPVSMAVIPALFVAAAVTSAGVSFVKLQLTGEINGVPGLQQDWAAWAPELLWPVWGVALAVAALAYRARREATT